MKNLINRFGFVRDIRDDAENERVISFTISDSSKDRHGTVLNMNGWNIENYKRNPIVGYQHDVYGGLFGSNPDNVIGTGNVRIENNEMIGDVKFEPKRVNPLAEKIFQKVLFGTLRATSVGFMPIGNGAFGKDTEAAGQENETYYYAGQELLEFSIVNVPSNPKATKRQIFEQFGQMLLNYFKPEELQKMTIAELLNFSETIEKQEKKEEVKETKYSYQRMKMELDLINL